MTAFIKKKQHGFKQAKLFFLFCISLATHNMSRSIFFMRFIYLFLIIAVFFFVSLLINISFFNIIGYSGIAYSLWLNTKYPQIKHNVFSYPHFLLASGYLLIYILQFSSHTLQSNFFFLWGTLQPSIQLLYFKPLRILFLSLFLREPINTRHGKFSDLLFSLSLLLLPTITALLIASNYSSE